MSLREFTPDTSKYVGNSVNLRDELRAIMRVHGHWAILRKRIKGRKCSCYNPQTDEAASDCKRCLGTGHAFVDHLVRLRKQAPFQTKEFATGVGKANPGTYKFWVQYHIQPERGDFIAEIALEEGSLDRNFQIQPTNPYTIVRIYDIHGVADMREFGGRLEFFTLVAQEAAFGDTA